MRTKSSILALLLIGAIGIGAAQTKGSAAGPRPSAEVLAHRQFEAALREYRAAQPASTELRDKVIRLARGLKTAPPIPDEASNSFDQAMAQMQNIAKPDDLKAAAKLFEKAAQAAPWYGEAYRSLGYVCDKLGDYDREKEWLLLYISTLRDEASRTAGRNLLQEAESRKAQAEFDRAMAAVKRNPSDFAARQRLVKLVASYNPPLPVPEEVDRYMARGKAAFEDAKEAGDYKDAVLQFQRARDAAPWYGPVYYSLGVALGNTGDYKAAKDNLSVYLASPLDPAQTKAAKDLIYEIEYKQEKAQAEEAKKKAAEDAERRAIQAKQALITGLNGNWSCKQGCGGLATVNLSQGSFSANLSSGLAFSGTFNEFAVEGVATEQGFYDRQSTCNIPAATHNFSGTVSEDGKIITLRTELNTYSTHFNTTPATLFTIARTTCTDFSVSNVNPLMVILSRENGIPQPPPPPPAPTVTPRRRGLFGK
ncbi:MAG: tetratricopeptide repeat protein [Candidatus Korobacteraceae bacterium]